VTSVREQLEASIELACRAHRGQRYPSPECEPYICHPLRVMLCMDDFDAQIVAVLHDVLEDTTVDVVALGELGLAEHVIDAVRALTHDPRQPYADYIERVAANPLARRVKLADLADNLSNNRRLNQTPEVVDRIARYQAAQVRLEAARRRTERLDRAGQHCPSPPTRT
jgi:(p)ppGpp synthase/HD superfamily hydrolase